MNKEEKRAYHQKRYAEKKEHIDKIVKKWQENNKDRMKAAQRKWRVVHPEKYLLRNARMRARRDGLPFNLEEDDIYIPETCPVLGIKMAITEQFRTDFSPSIDKLKPELGYVKGNVIVISWRANRVKSDVTDPEVFRKVATYVEKYIKESVCVKN